MAGARTVEEILARGGAEQFAITMFGDEPYGNYNRIMLSHVLSGDESDADIFLNTMAWYEENDITLHAGVRATRIDRFAKLVYAVNTADGSIIQTPYDQLIIATGSRSFLPAIEGLRTDDGELLSGAFAFRTIDDTRRMIEYARHDDHRRAVVIGGGLLGLEAARGLQAHGLKVDVVHAGPHLMNAQIGPKAGEILRTSVEKLGIEVHLKARTTAIMGEDTVRGVWLLEHPLLECDMVVVAAGIRPNVDLAVTSGFTVERAIVVDDQMRTVDDPDVYAVGECVQHRGEIYGLVAPLWEQAVVLAEHITGADAAAAYHGSRTATKLKVAGVDVAVDGPAGAGAGHRRAHRLRRTAPGRLQVSGHPRREAHRRDDARRHVEGRIPHPGLRSRAAAARGAARDAVQPRHSRRGGRRRGARRRHPGLQLQRRVQGRPGRMRWRAAARRVNGVMDKTRAGKGCGSCKTMVCQIVEWAAGGAVDEDPSANWYVPGIPMDKPALMAAIRDQRSAVGLGGVRSAGPEGAEDAKSKMGLASLLKMMWADEYIDEKDARFINDRVHANIQKDGTFSVVPQMKGGVTTPDQLRRIADVAEKWDVPMVKLTGGQRIDLLGIRKEDLPGVWADLGMPSGYAYGKSFRTVKTCVGQDFCRFGVGDSTKLGIEIEDRFQGLESPGEDEAGGLRLPPELRGVLRQGRRCGRHRRRPLGDLRRRRRRRHIRKGDLLATVDDPEAVMTLTGRFMQYYRENANWLERTYAFVPRIGIEFLREVIVDDSVGIAADLDARMQESIDAYRDPWQEGAAPATPGQFRTSLPLEVLPQVPVR